MTMVGQYEIKELLGAGGIGQVHAAFDTVLEREVVIKSLRLSDQRQEFSGTASPRGTSPAKLTHPKICRFTISWQGGICTSSWKRAGQTLSSSSRNPAAGWA